MTQRSIRISIIGLLVVTAIGLSLVALSKAIHQQNLHDQKAYNNARNYAHQATDEAMRKCGRIALPNQVECKRPIYDTAREQQRREYEIASAENAAVWSEAMGEAALIGVVFSVFTLILIFITFEEQRDANRRARLQFLAARRDALSASKTASLQLKVAQDTAYLELRAYLSLRAEVTNIAKTIIAGRFTIENTGQTPALIKVYAASWIGPVVGKRTPEMPEPVLDPQVSPYANARSIEQLDWFHPYGSFGTEDITQQWVANPKGKQLYYYGRVEFTDFQGRNTRVLNFCYRNRGYPTVGEGVEMVPLPWGNGYEKRDT